MCFPIAPPWMEEINLQVLMRDHGLCWVELGDEESDVKQLLTPFKESLFYTIPKSYYNTVVPQRNKPWEGGALVALPRETPFSHLVDMARARYRMVKNILRRPLWKRTNEEVAVRGTPADRDVIKKLASGGWVEFKRGQIWTQLLRQILLAGRLELHECVFLLPRVVSKMPAGCVRVPDNGIPHCTFFTLSV